MYDQRRPPDWMYDQREPPVWAVCLGFAIVACLLCGFIIGHEFYTDPEFSAGRRERSAARWLDKTYDRLVVITRDVPLVETTAPDTSISGTMSCVRGQAAHSFGTDRPYADVVADYSVSLLDHDWKQGDIPPDANTAITHLFYLPDDKLSRTIVIYPHDMGANRYFETVYGFGVYYTELRCTDFCPSWRCPG